MHPRRVAAWIYTVINPIVDSLERELSLLDSGDLGWTSRRRQSETIKTIQEYVDPTQWPNYKDFLAEHPKSTVRTGFKQHDLRLNELNMAASSVFDWMISARNFRDNFASAIDQYANALQGQQLRDSSNEFLKEAAQDVINNSRKLPSHYVMSAFWNFTGKDLLIFREVPEFLPVLRAKETLTQVSARLSKILEAYRLSLSRNYDVPAAPVPSIPFQS